MEIFIVLAMIFCHIFDDYKLQQGVLANLKQRSFWEQNAPDELYKYDYIMGLVMHSMSWSFMIMLPIAIYMGFNVSLSFLIGFSINACIHLFVDDLKANRKKINLITDQLIHILQIVATATLFFMEKS